MYFRGQDSTMILSALLGLALSLQLPQARTVADARRTTPRTVPAPTDSNAVAIRAEAAPAIDGTDDDPVWRAAPPITGFRQWQPTEGKEARFKTVAKVAYDAANLYVFVR